jgi:formate dehydrogenase iron-sulfur subunit
VASAPAAQKYIVCNADEGDSGTFADRMLMEGDPLVTDRGHGDCRHRRGRDARAMSISAANIPMRSARCRRDRVARQAGLLGASVLGSGHAFDMEVRVGAGAYVCGEETSLLNSLEGKRGTVRAKPPIPALEGFMGRPRWSTT